MGLFKLTMLITFLAIFLGIMRTAKAADIKCIICGEKPATACTEATKPDAPCAGQCYSLTAGNATYKGCAAGDCKPAEIMKSLNLTADATAKADCCKTDLCNYASSLTPSMFGIFYLVVYLIYEQISGISGRT